jgi:methionyl-tRNA formyltransferase
MRVAFFGLPLAAVLLADDGHEIVYAGACRPGPGLRRLASRVAPGRTWLRPDARLPQTWARVGAARPELLVSWFWTTRLPAQLLELAPAVGVHPSLLPRHRGADPYYWAIDAGDVVTGVTAHELDAGYDTGPVIGRREVPIDPGWNAWQLARALDRPSLDLLREVVRGAAAGDLPRGTPQDETAATQAPEPSESDLAIRWSWTAARIVRRVRAAAPWPGAWTELDQHVITLVHVAATNSFPRTLAAGEAAVRADGVAVVRTGDVAVELLEGRGAEDERLGWRELALRVEGART